MKEIGQKHDPPMFCWLGLAQRRRGWSYGSQSKQHLLIRNTAVHNEKETVEISVKSRTAEETGTKESHQNGTRQHM